MEKVTEPKEAKNGKRRQALERGEGAFDGVDVRGGGGQISQCCAMRFKGLVDPRHRVCGQSVPHHDSTGPQGRNQDLLDRGQEECAAVSMTNQSAPTSCVRAAPQPVGVGHAGPGQSA